MTDDVTLMFSYGSLRQPEVQRTVFGRELTGTADRLPGFALSEIRITDAAVIATSGSATHLILRRSEAADASVAGTALEIAPGDVPQADAYEVADYTRITVTLASGAVLTSMLRLRTCDPRGLRWTVMTPKHIIRHSREGGNR